MIYPIYSKKRCHRRDQIGMYDDSGYVYRGKKLPREGHPEDGSVAGRFDRQGRIYRDLYQRDYVGLMTADGLVYSGDLPGGPAEGRADASGCGSKGVAHDVPVVWVPEGDLRKMAAAAALLLLRTDVPADVSARGRFEDLPRWLEVVLDLALDLVELVVDIVT